MDIGTLIGYFSKKTEAVNALHELVRQGFKRTVMIYKSSDGAIHIQDPYLWRRAIMSTLAAMLFAAIAGAAELLLHQYKLLPDRDLYSSALFLLSAAACGSIAVFLLMRRSWFGVDRAVIRDHARWLVSGESVLVLQAPVESLMRPVAMLREKNDNPTVLFVMHPKRERRSEARDQEIKLTTAQIQDHAKRHAAEQHIDANPKRTDEIINRLKKSRQWIRRVCQDLTAASRMEQKATPAADWILDNEYILEGNIRDVLLNLPRRFYRQLPILATEPHNGMPCIYGLAKDLVSHTELRLDRENILSFIEAYQTVRTLNIGELWAIPQMLRIALVESIQSLAVTALADLRERQLAEFWSNRLIAANRRDSNQLFAILAELAKAEPNPSPYFGAQLIDLLYDEAASLSSVQNWLERTLKTSLHDFNLREQNRQTLEQLSCGNAFTSLRQLAQLDWREIFEKLSSVELTLRLDPSGIYPAMDFATRDSCRRAIEELALASGQTETHVAGQVIWLATKSKHEAVKDDRQFHVGSWLTGAGRAELARFLNCREKPYYRTLQWIYSHHTAVYASGIGSISILFYALFACTLLWNQSATDTIGLLLLLLIPFSQLSIDILNYLLTRYLPTRPLPKMDFEITGIPDEFLTLVVIPMMLVNRETILAEVEKLEIRYLANKENNLLFSLFTDYTDSATLSRDDDKGLLKIASDCLTELNQRHDGQRFFLFHRERTWSESEQKFIGWERKRGKLEELNSLIDGTRPENSGQLVYVGNRNQLADIRFIITLDSDTQLPHGTARRLIETLAHPLNQPRFDEEGRLRQGSYTIIQPRVSPTLPSTSVSIFSRLFADAVGIDPYTQAVSDVYQDLSGEGSYHGKGIYDVRAFSRVLAGRFPEDWVLSHDLIEGAHVRVGLASDIELYDEFPQGYQSYSNRAHRWIRGDWQIAGWIFRKVPLATGGRGTNPLTAFNRWKILDNLRRSLLPVANLVLMIASWLISPAIGLFSILVVVMQLLFHPLSQPFTMATTPKGMKYFSPPQLVHDLLRATADAALLPHQAGVALDAIIRVLYRRMISGRNLLEWSAQSSNWSSCRRQPIFVASLTLCSLLSISVGWAIWQLMPDSLPQASIFLLLWLFSPLLGLMLNLHLVEVKTDSLPENDTRFLRQVARRTWRYFSSFVNSKTSWLPPDNYQVAHQNRLAMRTSPTNIGLWMTSVLGAHDCGYLTINRVLEKLTETFTSIDRLELHKGHLLNWYDIRTLAPLEPRYVSTVDSGNLLGALWTVEQGLEEILRAPLLNGRPFAGLADTGEIIRQIDDLKKDSGLYHHTLQQLLSEWNNPPSELVDQLRLQRRMQVDVSYISTLVGVEEELWTIELRNQVSDWIENSDRYLVWVEILAEQNPKELEVLGSETSAAILMDLKLSPSLYGLAHGHSASVARLRQIRKNAPQNCDRLFSWMDRVIKAFETSQWLAGETVATAERLLLKIRNLSDNMQMGFLYDKKRKLFTIGYNVSIDRPDQSSYDLLASEARLGSFVAIARGDIPMEHWFSLGRPYGAIRHQRVLLSWTGTMFEYLMPLLLQHSYEGSLLDKAARVAVEVQIAYVRKRKIPWGISESAFADLDQENTYQYKAFGVPTLGLKRGIEEQLVIAPYATLLALSLAPAETVKNLKKLSALGMMGEYGYFEAMDFSRQSQRKNSHGVVVQAYMAHHQGMSFISLVNFIYNNPFQQRFHRDPRVRAFEALLQERIPTLPPLHLISTRQSEPVQPGTEVAASTGINFATPHTTSPRCLLLSNGTYSLMITNSGGGYSQWGNHELTRWRSDQTCDSQGTFCYIHEPEDDQLWSTTYHPVEGNARGYSVDFMLDRAVFRRNDNGIQTETEVIVSPEDDLEVRRITLVNRSNRVRRLNITSYAELSMALHNADRQHPAFNKLFIETEALAEQQLLLAFRRPRVDNEPALYVGHSITVHQPGHDNQRDQEWQFETDRRQFIGRGRTMTNPAAARQQLGNSQGYVLDPVLSIRRRLTIQPGQRIQVSLLLAAGSSREKVLMMMDKFNDQHATERAMDFAWAAAQQQLQVQHIQPEEAHRFQRLASHLLFPNQLLRAPAERLAENKKGQSGLWPYAISGDLPLTLITIGEVRDISLVRQMLQAHNYWQMHGLSSDLVIFNEEVGSYERPLQERLEQMIHIHSLSSVTNRPGQVYLKSLAQIPEEDQKLLKAAACIVLVAARGTLPQQLGITTENPEQLEKLVRKKTPREPSTPLPFLELDYFNSLGGFTKDGREYAIYLGPGSNTPAPWVNIMANPEFGTMVSETGSGFTWFGNSQRNRLTGWSNDPTLDPASEAIYIRDEESGLFWSPTAAPIREESAYRARHGAGYTVFEHNSNGIEQELTIFVPVDENGGKTVKLQRLRLTNGSPRKRRLSVTYYVELNLGENRETSQMHVVTNWDSESRTMLARNRYHPDYGERITFVGMSPQAETFGGDRTTFIGRNRNLANPAGMEYTELSKQCGAGLDPCAVLRASIDLAPGEQRDMTFILGQAGSVAEAVQLSNSFHEPENVEETLLQTIAWWNDLLGTIQVRTPELATDLLINRWLQYQSLSCRIWGRSGFYQSGGAYGFRDQLQDVMALLYTKPELARAQILLAAGRQFKEGDVQHWWHPPSGAGIRSRITDDLLWLPYVVAQYVKTTGDLEILTTEITFLNAPLLNQDQHEQFSTPEITLERSTLFEHCRRAVSKGLTIGPHGLPLIGTGDWNDGMNLVGSKGKGESVWLAWFLCDLLQGMAKLSNLMQQPELGRTYLKDRSDLIRRTELAGWDGDWYLRGTFDDGSPLGSAANMEAKIDSLPQSWAWLSGAADPARADQALESAWQHLVLQNENMVLLFEPPFDKTVPSPGYIKGYPPGVRENGGQYTHAAIWMAMAMARKGDGERAVQLLRMLNPIEHARDAETTRHYMVEPYVVTADIYRLPGKTGQGGWSWYTGSAAWMYRAWIEEVIGLKVNGNQMEIKPVIPAAWSNFYISYRHGETVYSIQVENPQGVQQGVAWVEMDGKRLPNGIIALESSLVKHQVVVMMG